MCISPKYIPNPNFGMKKEGFHLLKDCTSAFIAIPCRVCPQCIAVRQMELIQRIHMESLFCHLFFCTLTYNDASLPVFDVNGYSIKYARSQDFTDLIKRVRKYSNYPFRAFGVSEFGSKYGRPHFHLIVSVPKSSGDFSVIERHLSSLFLREWRRNYGSTRKPIYQVLCTFTRKYYDGRLSTNFDFHYINPMYSDDGVADVGFYVLKYLLKADKHEKKLQQALHMNLHPTLYRVVWDVVRSDTHISKGIGLLDFSTRGQRSSYTADMFNSKVVSHIRKGIDYGKGKFPYPVFLHPLTGKTFPLSHYYKDYFFTPEDAFSYYYDNVGNSPYLDSIHDADIKALNQTLSVIDKYKRRCDIVNSKTFL